MKRNKLTFTVLSNDAEQVVTRFQLPRILITITLFIFIIALAFLTFSVYKNYTQQQTNSELKEKLQAKTLEAENLQDEVEVYEMQEATMEARMDDLEQLETKVQETIEELPVDIDSKGGIDVDITDEKLEQLTNSSDRLEIQSNELIKRYEQTLKDVEQTNEKLQYIPTVWPAHSNTITSEYGLRKDPFNRSSSFHTGLDIRGKIGDPVYASAAGKVTKADYYGGYGKTIIIKHTDEQETLYAHLTKIDVKEGEIVKKGAEIGGVGSTGRSTGPHLHFEVIEDGEPVNPLLYLDLFNKKKE